MVQKGNTPEYRDVIYSNYSKHAQITGQTPARYSYQRWAAATRWYVRGWLPDDLDVPILDLGCGAGYFLYLAQMHGYRNLSGVDLSAEQVALARQSCPRAQIVLQDVQEVLARSQSYYGLITGFDIIEHFKKNELLSLLNLIVTALAPGGRVIFQTPNAESPWGLKIRYGDFTHELAVSPQSLNSLLAIVGLVDYQARECGPYVHGLKSLTRFLLWRGFHAFLTLWNVAETGDGGSGIYTRVFVATACKPKRGEDV